MNIDRQYQRLIQTEEWSETDHEGHALRKKDPQKLFQGRRSPGDAQSHRDPEEILQMVPR